MFRYGWPLIALAALAVFVSWQGHWFYPNSLDDAYRYVAMAHQPFGSLDPLTHQPPYAWRILTPLLVFLLPLNPLTGFWIVTLLGLAGAALALMWFLRGVGVSSETTIAGGLAFVCLMPATAWTLYDDKLVDPLAFALLTLALAACVHRIGWLMLLALALCALDKETAIFGVIFALAWNWQKRDHAMLCWSLVSLGSVLAVLIGLRAVLPANAYNWNPLLICCALGTLVSPLRLTLALVGAWGILLPLAFASPVFWRTPAFSLFWLAATAQVFVSYDIERVIVYAFPVMIAASCFTIEALATRWRMSHWWLWIPVFALELSWTYTYGPHYVFTLTGLYLPFVAIYLAAALFTVILWLRQHERQKHQMPVQE